MIRHLLLISIAAATIAPAATAQTRAKGYKEPGIGTLVGGRQSSVASQSDGGIDETRRIVQPAAESLDLGRRTARCVARTEPVRSARFVMTGPEVSARAAYGPIQGMMENCLGRRADVGIGALDISRRLLQSFLAEALVQRAPPLALAPLPLDQAQYPRDLATLPLQQRVVDEMAICLAYTQPAKAEALIRSEPASPVEKAAFADITPSLQACVPQNMTLQANKAGVRLATGLALFRRAQTPQQTAKK